MHPTLRVDVAVVGGGSAGMAAANVAAHHALQVCIIDERAGLGGQNPHGAAVRELVARTQRQAAVRHFAGATAWGLFPAEDPEGKPGSHYVQFYDASGLRRVHAHHVFLATGGYETPVPFLGWDLPGVMSARDIAVLPDAAGTAPSQRVVLAGTHPRLLDLCERLMSAGVRVHAVAFAQPLWQFLAAACASTLTIFRQLATLRRGRVPVMFQHRIVAATGGATLTGVRLRGPSGFESEFSCATLGLGYGQLASTELARQVGAQYAWLDDVGWVIQADAFMRSSVPGVSVAGNEVGIDCHDMAQLCGEIAATGIAVDRRRLDVKVAEESTKARRKRLAKWRRTALAATAARSCAVPIADLDRATLICRCEGITVGTLCEALKANPDVSSASAVKSLTRVGMGRCQGRACEISVRRLIAQQRGDRLRNVPSFAVRAPIKPLPIGLVAATYAPFDPQEFGNS